MHPYGLLPHVLILTLIIMPGLFVDGALCDMLSWPYHKPESSLQNGTYTIGDTSEAADMSWCLASAYLLAAPLGTYLTRSSFPVLLSPLHPHRRRSPTTSTPSRASLLRHIPRSYTHQVPHIRCFHFTEYVLNKRNQKFGRFPLDESSQEWPWDS